jgi:hypothetical protein
MKSDDFQEIQQTKDRSDQVAGTPASRGFKKIPGTRRSEGAPHKKLKSESNKFLRSRNEQKTLVMIRSLLVLGLTTVVLGLFLVLWFRSRIKPPGLHDAKSGGSEVKTKAITQFPAPTSDEAIALVKQALAIREPEKIAEYFRLDEAGPQEIIDFLQATDDRDGKLEGMRWLSSVRTTAVPLEGVLLIFKGQDGPRRRWALLTPDPLGKWRIDFDAFARKVTPSWSDLLEKQMPVGMVRVFVSKDHYYNGPFTDDKIWLSCAINSLDSRENLNAYCKIGSPQAAAIRWMLSKEAKIVRAILEIRRVEGAESRQFEISKVLAEDWVMGPTPFDENFK